MTSVWKASRSNRHPKGIVHLWGPYIVGPVTEDSTRVMPACGGTWRAWKDLEEPNPEMPRCTVCAKKQGKISMSRRTEESLERMRAARDGPIRPDDELCRIEVYAGGVLRAALNGLITAEEYLRLEKLNEH